MNRPLMSTGWILLATVILVAALIPFDPQVSLRAQKLPAGVLAFNERITDFGKFGWMIYGSGILIILAYIAHTVSRNETISAKARTGRRVFLYFFLTIGSASALVHLLKFLIGRARPELLLELGAYSFTPFTGNTLFESFPSGHSAAVGSFCGAFSMLVPRLRLLFLVLALAIGISRVVVGAHYPSDVAAGLLLGLWTALMMAFVFARRNWLFRLDDRGWPRPKTLAEKNAGPQT
ncbi:phosphatase PAP2 family protein [Sinorhizobium sp. BG8]|uniref:phosphatase PAP2 family protein n=1 Tax=Sinorhizobium sp. BG8 TaxID=2613773 RepID=UPI00193D67DE|nr:phosphatase PAP2 family protein [Sinorhizobium sp. BG8]QRM53608.1 phosphatase PAP2 family protein [Sinorhizobium sp. BG8]